VPSTPTGGSIGVGDGDAVADGDADAVVLGDGVASTDLRGVREQALVKLHRMATSWAWRTPGH